MRIGTWNLDGRWGPDHHSLLMAQDCDVWLLTEVRTDVTLPGFESLLSTSMMAKRKHWAGVFSLSPLQPWPDPHPASVAASSMGFCFCSSILPWHSCGTRPWGEGTHGERTERAINDLMAALPVDGLVWGGDWNHAMDGPERAGSHAGRAAIKEALAGRQLKVTTANSPHRIAGLGSIDHIAVPQSASIVSTHRVVGQTPTGKRLSDHDAYVSDITVT